MKKNGFYWIICLSCILAGCERNSCPVPALPMDTTDITTDTNSTPTTPVNNSPFITAWNAKTSGTPSNLIDVYFPDNNTGYICGAGGVILKSIDGGETWNPQTSGTTVDLMAIQFLDATTGYAAGNNETILKTTDGGATWVPQSYDGGSLNHIRTIKMFSNDNVYMGGLFGSFFTTTNGGTNWNETTIDGSTSIYAMHFPTTDDGMIGGNFTRIRKTNNASAASPSWTVDDPAPIHHSSTSPYYAIHDFHFFDLTNGFAVAGYAGGIEKGLIKTTDGALSWIKNNNPDALTAIGEFYNDIDFDNSWDNGIIVTTSLLTGNLGNILQSSDGGDTWSIAQEGPYPNLNKVFTLDNGNAIVIGNAGTIVKGTP